MTKQRLLIGILALGLFVLLVWGFVAGRAERAKEAEREKPVAAPSRVAQVDGMPAITLDAAGQRAAGIVVTPPHETSRRAEVQALGTVLTLEDLTALRTALVEARGKREAAVAAEAASHAEYQRLLLLHQQERDVSTKDLQAGEASWRADQATLLAATAAEAAARQAASQQWGAALARSVGEGSPLYRRLVDGQDVLVQVSVPAGAAVEPPAEARLQLGRTTFAIGRLVARATRADARLQGATFFYTAHDAGLLPGSSLTVFLPVGSTQPAALVPASAIVWWQGRAWVYTQHRPGLYVRHALPEDQATPGGWLVPRGFAGAEAVVTTGAQLLLSEEFRAQISVGEEGE